MNRNRKYDAQKLIWLRDGKKFIVLLAVVFCVFRFVIGFSMVDGISMNDTLQNNEIVFYTRINAKLKRGDIVSVGFPDGKYYVKRIVAIAGDTVDIHGGKLYVNGIEETDAWVKGATLPEQGMFEYPLTIGNGDIFVLGDNRPESIDSRYFGSISERMVKGVLHFGIGWRYFHLY